MMENTAAFSNTSNFGAFVGYDRLAILLGIYPEKIKYGEVISGITGIYEGVMTQEELNNCLNITNSILGE